MTRSHGRERCDSPTPSAPYFFKNATIFSAKNCRVRTDDTRSENCSPPSYPPIVITAFVPAAEEARPVSESDQGGTDRG